MRRRLISLAAMFFFFVGAAEAKTVFGVLDGAGNIAHTSEVNADKADVPQDGSCKGCIVIAPNDARLVSFQAEQGAPLPGTRLAITSTGTPGINGIYATDPAWQAKIASVATYIAVNNRFPAGQTSLPWPDAAGVVHLFPSPGVFQTFASAVADFVTATELGLAPSSRSSIP